MSLPRLTPRSTPKSIILVALALLVLLSTGCRNLISEPVPVDDAGAAAGAPAEQDEADTGEEAAPSEDAQGADEEAAAGDEAEEGTGEGDGSAGSSGVGAIGDGSSEDPIRVLFEPGTDRITIDGRVGTDLSQSYVLGASAGQRMAVALSQPSGEISVDLSVRGPDGAEIVRSTESWSGVLEADGDHVITVSSILTLGDKDYRMTVSIGEDDRAGDDDDGRGSGAVAGAPDARDDGFKTTRQMRQLGEVTFHFTTVPGKGGETKVIDVSGPNGFFQRIVPPDYPEPMGGPDDALFLAVEDMDFDETDDFRVMQMIPAGAYFPYYYWLWQPGLDQFAYHEPYEPLLSPVFEDGRIKSPWRAGAAQWGEDTYIVFEDVPELERKEQWDVELDTPEGMARHRVWEYDFANGTEELVVDEMVPHS